LCQSNSHRDTSQFDEALTHAAAEAEATGNIENPPAIEHGGLTSQATEHVGSLSAGRYLPLGQGQFAPRGGGAFAIRQ
jgi:hypothetical protein